jgi:hypothetical protein
MKLDHEFTATCNEVKSLKELQKSQSKLITSFGDEFEKISTVTKTRAEKIDQTSGKQEFLEHNLILFKAMVVVVDESIIELERKWMNWGKGEGDQQP